MADAASRGDQLVKDAEKRLSSWGFNKQAKYEDAADLFAKAGAQYKIEKNYEKAGNAFKSAGQNSEKAGNMAEALQNYQNAGKAYAQDAETLDEAIKTYEMVVRMLTESNRFSQAAKLCKEIGSLYEQDMKTEKAIEKYEQAAHYFQSEDSKTTANQCLLLAADLLAGQEQYKKAVETYEKVATASLESALTKWSVTEYLFKASICQLVMDARQGSGRCPLAQIAVDKYLDLHPPFETSREYKLLKTIFEAFEASNVQAFTDALFDYNQVSPLDNFKSGLLLKVKRLMVESDDGAAAKAAAGANPNDDDEPNWT